MGKVHILLTAVKKLADHQWVLLMVAACTANPTRQVPSSLVSSLNIQGHWYVPSTSTSAPNTDSARPRKLEDPKEKGGDGKGWGGLNSSLQLLQRPFRKSIAVNLQRTRGPFHPRLELSRLTIYRRGSDI